MNMKDDFIYKALPKIRKDFAESLYTKLSAQSPTTTQRKAPQKARNLRWSQAAMIAFGLLILVAASQIRLWIRYVPIGDLWLIEFSLTQPASNIQTVEAIPTPGSLPTMIINDGTEASVIYLLEDFEAFPDWIPEGFSATQIPGDGYSYEESIGMWINDAGETIRLFVVPIEGGARPYAPPGMYKEVQINGQPAIVVYGRLAPNSPENPQAQRKWDKTLGLQLTWKPEKFRSIYTLETLGTYVTEQDLIRMAEGIKRAPPSP
jgi:hypothetical protein